MPEIRLHIIMDVQKSQFYIIIIASTSCTNNTAAEIIGD